MAARRRRPSAGRKATNKPPRKLAPARAARPSVPVRVRMYRQGLGDCFLVTFGRGPGARHLLIDCGTLGATTTGVKLADVVNDIRSETGGKPDVLVVTHEHQDHLSGFKTQRTVFDTIHPDRVWLAWTEDPSDADARRIAKYKNDVGLALAATMKAMVASQDAGLARIGEQVQGILATFGDDLAPGGEDPRMVGAGKFSPSVDEAMDYVRTKQGANVEFLQPDGKVREESWLPGFRFYVLGPPRGERALKDTGEHGSDQLYGVVAGLATAADFLRAHGRFATYSLGAESLGRRSRFDRQMPFDPRFRRERRTAAIQARLARGYLDAGQTWRQIEEDWLHVAADLALQLDSATNNTSLVLAIERISDGRVLLFPADAQQGNWLSWHENLAWQVSGPGGGQQKVTAADLLRRTVFYKVGHHGSHNATARGKGLELMERRAELTAFIPVDRAVALGRHPKNSWRMPARALYRRLLEQCGGRVVRSDLGWAEDPAKAKNRTAEKEFDGMATAADWKRWDAEQKACAAAGKVTVTALFVDYVLS